MAADGTFQRTLPRLVESFYDVDTKVLALAERQYVLNHARLVRGGWQRLVAHAAGARPADLADDHLFASESVNEPLPDRPHMRGGRVRRNRQILPVRQDMDRYEINGGGDVRIA